MLSINLYFLPICWPSLAAKISGYPPKELAHRGWFCVNVSIWIQESIVLGQAWPYASPGRICRTTPNLLVVGRAWRNLQSFSMFLPILHSLQTASQPMINSRQQKMDKATQVWLRCYWTVCKATWTRGRGLAIAAFLNFCCRYKLANQDLRATITSCLRSVPFDQ